MQTYHLFVRATARQLWDAITTPEYSADYLFGALVETTGEPGTPFRYHSPDRTALWGDNTVLETGTALGKSVEPSGRVRPE